MTDENLTLSMHLAEYEQLKLEQTHRLNVRDNLIYVMLTVFGAVISYSLSDSQHYHSLLVLPWAALVLGWTYLLNDQKISEIRRYIKTTFIPNINKSCPEKKSDVFCWEKFSSESKYRRLKKYFQLFVNLTVFCFSGIAGIIIYIAKTDSLNTLALTVVTLGAVVMAILALWFLVYSEF